MNETKNLIELKKYLEIHNPKMAKKLIPANDEEIKELQKYNPDSPIPEAYLSFLKIMGHGLKLQTNADYDTSTILARYKYGYTPPKNFWMFGRVASDPYYDQYVSSTKDKECNIFSFPPAPKEDASNFISENGIREDCSLSSFLSRNAVLIYEIQPLEYFTVISSPNNSINKKEHCEEVLQSLGFSRMWFSNTWHSIYKSERGFANLSEKPMEPTVILFTSNNQEFTREFVQKLI